MVVAHHVSSCLRSSTWAGCTVTWNERTAQPSRLAGNQLYSSESVSGGLKFLTREFGWARASREVAERPVGILTKLSSETWRLEIDAPWLRPTCSKGWILDQNRVQGEGKYGRRALTSTKCNCEQGLVSVASRPVKLTSYCSVTNFKCFCSLIFGRSFYA